MASTSRQPEIEIVNAFDGLAPSSASTSATSSSSLQKLPCDVFINHRGPDVKDKLARDIYSALHALGLNVFLDSQELQLGIYFPKNLQEAMSRASVHLAIFSPTYAQSPWCLAELSFMLKTGTPIIPIFYHVSTEDVRHLKGVYAASFLEHQKKGRYGEDKLEDWKKALHTVSFNKGEVVNNDEEEQRVLKNIVNHVLKVMKIAPLTVAQYPVGLEEVVAGFEMTIREFAKSHSNVQFVGIWGMGGSGKTTLAKELYNQKCSSIEKSSFLFNIRDAANKDNLHKMQRQLLQDCGFKFNDQHFNNIEQGKNILSNYLRSIPVLVVLDDVDHQEQLEALLPVRVGLEPGSLIIVTTRDKEVLRVCGISCIYEMKSMDEFYARQLFCWHAFLRPFPLSGYEDLVEKFISVSNGLPLSLKVFGARLYGCSNKDLWKDVLQKISRILPDNILKRLRVSYEALDEEEQQMFLDIACFFSGGSKIAAIAVWEGSGWSGLCGLERLVNKCLVDLVHEDEIRMHDHLRDLGRKIANTLPPYRLWSPYQFAGTDKQGEMRGMILNTRSYVDHKFPGSLLNTSISLCGFKITRRPKFPYGLKVFMVGRNYGSYLDIAKSSRELAWLSCTGIAHRNFPSWMTLKNLRVLELYDCPEIVGLWKDGVQKPVELRVLVVSSCPKLKRIPRSIGAIKNLKKISLSSCNVESLPEEFCCLQSLEHLQLRECTRLSSLPNFFGHLTRLRHLDMSGCYALSMLPVSCKQLTLLQRLDLQRCWRLTLQPDIVEYMTMLEYLNLNECRKLEELPLHITNQASLSELYLDGTSLRELPINIGQLSKLRVMKISTRSARSMRFPMRPLPDSMGSHSLLEHLEISNCKISEINFGPSTLWSNLKSLILSFTTVSKISISNDCCPCLKTLYLSFNGELREVDALPAGLESFSVEISKIRNLSVLGAVVNLRLLMLKRCRELETLPNFDKLASLKIFKLKGGNKVEAIHGLHHCTSLEELSIEGKRWEVSGIESWEHVQRLRWLCLQAKKRSAVERCIQTIQKWPDDVMIYTKAVAGAGSLLNSSAFPNLSVIHSIANKKIGSDSDLFTLSSDGNSMMVCLVINCRHRTSQLRVYQDSRMFGWEGREVGKWIFILRCRNAKNSIGASFVKDNEVEKGMVVSGEEESVVECFHRILALLAI